MTRTHLGRGRTAFTLVELLVVVVLIIILAAMAVAVLNSNYVASNRVISGADLIGRWSLISKQRAKRDGAPRGVRFFLNPDPSIPAIPRSFVGTDAQYIESPDPWSPNPAAEANPSGPRLLLVYKQDDVSAPAPHPTNQLKRDLTVGSPTFGQPTSDSRMVFFVTTSTAPGQAQAELNEFDQRVGVGDFLVLPEFGTSYRITGIIPTPTPPQWPALPLIGAPGITTPPGLTPDNARLIMLATYPDLGPAFSNAAGQSPTPPAFLTPTMTTYQFSFQPAPRPLLGEPTLQVTGSTLIDYRAPMTAPPFPAGTLTGGNIGYRDWNNPPPATFPNPAPYWPTTTIGVNPNSLTTPTHFDILFAPSGQVMFNSNPYIALWVRGADKVAHPRLADPSSPAPSQLDIRANFDEAGEQVLVVIYTRTGLIATHPIQPSPATVQNYDPYKNVKDGINSGL